jgi:uracil-DNA glycosylase family 4
MFTGDRSGEWLYRALHRAGFASQAESRDLSDPLQLDDCAITAVCHCAPPDNRPTAEEQHQCQPWLSATLDLVPARVILALGQIAWNAVRAECRRRDWLAGPQPPFGHARQIALTNGRWLVGSYHPSQQNTFTGRLTEQMLDDIFRQIRGLLSRDGRAVRTDTCPGAISPSAPSHEAQPQRHGIPRREDRLAASRRRLPPGKHRNGQSV